MAIQIQSVKISESFVMSDLVEYVRSRFAVQGYIVIINTIGNSVQITLQKNIGGIHMVTGLGEQITTSLSVKDNQLTFFSSNQSWNDKVIAGVVGWFCCGVTLITGAIGLFKQIQLPNDVNASIFTYVSGL